MASLQQSCFFDLIIAYRYNTSFSKIGDPDPDIHLDWYFFNTYKPFTMTWQDVWLLIRKLAVSVLLYLLPLLFVWATLQILRHFVQ